MRGFLAFSIVLALTGVVAAQTAPQPNVVTVTTLPLEQAPGALPFERSTPAEEAIQIPGEEIPAESPEVRRPGWFGLIDALVVLPSINGQRAFPAGFAPVLPSRFPKMNDAGSGPSPGLAVVFGYRLNDGLGDLTLGYRFMADEESSTDAFGSGTRTRFNINVIDLAYANHIAALGPSWDLRWQAGPRLVTFFMDDLAQVFGLYDQASNSYVGAGPAGGVGLARDLGRLGASREVSIYGGVDGAVLFGQASQTLQESITSNATPSFQYSHLNQSTTSEMLGAEFGVRSQNIHNPLSFFTIGYRYDQWWGLGSVGGSRLDFRANTFFLRWQRNF